MSHIKTRPPVFFKNYDLYEINDGQSNIGPGAGFYSNMQKYKSVFDFLKKKRKARNKILKKLLKNASKDVNKIDFISDQYDNPTTESQFDYGNMPTSVSGLTYRILTPDDSHKNISQLDFSTDHDNEYVNPSELNDLELDLLLTPEEPGLIGGSNEIQPISDLDHIYDTDNQLNQYYQISNEPKDYSRSYK